MKITHDVLKYRLGVVCIILSFVSPVIGLIIPFFNLPIEIKATLATVLLVGLPEVFLLIGAALAGKQATQALAAKVRACFGKTKPPAHIGRFRYHLGLILFFGGMLLNWVLAYAGPAFIQDIGVNYYWVTTFIIDLVTIAGFFVAGAPFWEKIKKLFVWEEEA
ncbi:MAG: transporter suffix domain-containing protein [Legionellaceae bacterium]|nr:transporter suffix domain-containing protein [Legionellaceae bacterium]